MLISEKLNKVLNNFETGNISNADLYARINHDLDFIMQNLQFDIKGIEKNLDSKISSQNKEFQNTTIDWLTCQLKDLNKELQSNNESFSKNMIETLSKNILDSINKKIGERLDNIKNEVDLSEVVEKIKNDKETMESIKNEVIESSLQDLLKDKQSMSNEIRVKVENTLLEYLKNEIKIESIIKTSIDSVQFSDEMNNKINTKVDEAIKTNLDIIDFEAKIQENVESFKTHTESKKSEFEIEITKLLESLKQENTTNATNATNALLNHLKELENDSQDKLEAYQNNLESNLQDYEGRLESNLSEFETKLENLLESLKENNTENIETLKAEFETKKEVILSEYKNKLDKTFPFVIQEIINEIVTQIMHDNNIMNHIKDSIIKMGYDYTLTFEDEIKKNIESKVIEFILDNVSEQELLQAILNDIGIQELIETQGYEATKDMINHAMIKDFVTESLNERANEIFQNDEFLRIEVEAQAHLVAMRLQSQLSSIQICLDKMLEKYDVDNKLAILLEKEKVFNEALANAKKDLQDEINKELPKFDTKIQDAINAYDLEQDKQTDTKIDTLKNDLLTTLQDEINKLNQNNGNTNANITQIIDNLKLELNDLSTKLQAQENINTQQEAKIEANTKLNEAQEQKLQDSQAKDKDIESKLEKLEKDVENNAQNQNKTSGGKYLLWS